MKIVSGKAIGGKARAKVLSSEERTAIAKKGAAARWDKSILKASHGDEDHPLKIGDIEIPAYVLEDGTRVLVQRGLAKSIGLSTKGSGTRVSTFIGGKLIRDFISSEIIDALENPIKFKAPNGALAHGYKATILADICDAVLLARKSGRLLSSQNHIAEQCEILVRGFARVGIIALVDEATGYQEDRTRTALTQILEAFIAEEIQPWLKTFPTDFYKELFRLRDLEFNRDSIKRPQYFGKLTNDIVYKRLAPGILEELKKVTPRDKKGRPTARYFQKLTLNTGYTKLREHLGSVVTLMKLSDDYNSFVLNLDKIHPRFDKTMPLELEY